jgi:protein-L-isoaspartate(D-aspartate) O-methyltransferase
MNQVPRELFVSESQITQAYLDHALPIDCGQTISQPFIVALMTQHLLHGKRLKKVLEIGTGSGYQAAVLAQLVEQVYSVERIKKLYRQAKQLLALLGFANIQLHFGDGNLGWPEHSPYDGILVAAAAIATPPALLEQLKPGGRLIIPVEHNFGQDLKVITRIENEFVSQIVERVMFVPLLKGVE